MSSFAPYAARELAHLPPPGWSVVGRESPELVRRAGELAAVLPPHHYTDEARDDGTWVRFYRCPAGVGCLRWDGDMLGDAPAAAPNAWDSGAASWWLLGAVLVGVGGLIYVATRPLEARASSSESRSERNERVEQNLAPEYVPLWRRMRGQFKGGTSDERAERFMEWAETDEGQGARAELLEELALEGTRELVLERDGCTCNDDDSPHCCGRGCCSYHRGIRGRVGDEVPF